MKSLLPVPVGDHVILEAVLELGQYIRVNGNSQILCILRTSANISCFDLLYLESVNLGGKVLFYSFLRNPKVQTMSYLTR